MPLGPRFSTALSFANELHGSQVRKGSGTPYVAHLLSVAALVIEAGGSEDAAIAALLHDAVEDQGGAPALKRIRQRFGPKVATIVDANTETDQTPKPPWKQRKVEYIKSIPKKSREVLLVSLADKVHNVRSIVADHKEVGDQVWTRFKGGNEGTVWYYKSLVRAFKGRTPEPMWEVFSASVKELATLASRSDRNTIAAPRRLRPRASPGARQAR